MAYTYQEFGGGSGARDSEVFSWNFARLGFTAAMPEQRGRSRISVLYSSAPRLTPFDIDQANQSASSFIILQHAQAADGIRIPCITSKSGTKSSVLIAVLMAVEEVLVGDTTPLSLSTLLPLLPQDVTSLRGFNGNPSVLSEVWPTPRRPPPTTGSAVITVTVPHGAFEESSVEARSVGALLRRMCAQKPKVRIITDSSQRRTLVFSGPVDSSQLLQRRLEHLCAAADVLSPSVKHKGSGSSPTRYFATLPDGESTSKFLRAASGLESVSNGQFRSVGLAFVFEVELTISDLLNLEAALWRGHSPDPTTRLIVEELHLPGGPSSTEQHSPPRPTQSQSQLPIVQKTQRETSPVRTGSTQMHSFTSGQHHNSIHDASMVAGNHLASDELTHRMSKLEEKLEALRDHSTHAYVEYDSELKSIKDKAADSVLVEKAVTDLRGEISIVEELARGKTADAAMEARLVRVINELRENQDRQATAFQRLESLLESTLASQQQTDAALSNFGQRLHGIEEQLASRGVEDAALFDLQQRQQATQIAINELHQDLHSVNAEAQSHRASLEMLASELQQTRRSASRAPSQPQHPGIDSAIFSELDSRVSRCEVLHGRVAALEQRPDRQRSPSPHYASTQLPPGLEEDLTNVKNSVALLESMLDGFDPSLAAKTTERTSNDVKELKRRLNEVELTQANLEGLAAAEEGRSVKMNTLVRKVDELETKMAILQGDDADIDGL